jgi:hypothetical protein
LLRHEPRFSAYRDFFETLRAYETELLGHPPAKPIPLYTSLDTERENNETGAEAHQYGNLVFLSNYNDDSGVGGAFDYGGRSYFLTNHSVVLLDQSSGSVLFNTSVTMLLEEQQSLQKHAPAKSILITHWGYFQEKVGYGARTNPPSTSPEQLNITNNDSDYVWYSFIFNQTGDIFVRLYGYDGLYYVYIDGTLSSDNTVPFIEESLPMTASSGRILSQNSPASPNVRRMDVLSVAMGLYNGDVGPHSSKGIQNITVGNNQHNTTYTDFSTQWMLLGEELQVYTLEGSKRVDWQPVAGAKPITMEDSLIWFQGRFEIPKELLPFVGKGQPNQTALVANLSGMQKGVVYVNGFNIGRYWLTPGTCDGGGDCAPPHHGPHCYIHWKGCGKPTQHLYHIPFEVLRERDNVLTLFEETADVRDLSKVTLEVLHHHPDLA